MGGGTSPGGRAAGDDAIYLIFLARPYSLSESVAERESQEREKVLSFYLLFDLFKIERLFIQLKLCCSVLAGHQRRGTYGVLNRIGSDRPLQQRPLEAHVY
mmetsp:Transcript_4934/g.10786  ORF Transcript_4934/g.10786 Transcript_4934/m.10786 type:complete len:101 (-) Transcript_4934:166-468(-)